LRIPPPGYSGGPPGVAGRGREGVALVVVLVAVALAILTPLSVSFAQDQKPVSFHGVSRDRLNQPKSIRVEDIVVEVRSTTVIRDLRGKPVPFEDLQVSKEVTVTGYATGIRYFVAQEIVLTPPLPQ